MVGLEFHLTHDPNLDWKQYVPVTTGKYTIDQSVIFATVEISSYQPLSYGKELITVDVPWQYSSYL